MNEYKIHPSTLYDYTAGVCCGVLVSEKVMRKLVALQNQHLESVKRLLSDNSDEVYPSMWTLHHPDGVQTVVKFIDIDKTVGDAIKNATYAGTPTAVFPVFIAKNMKEASEFADARYKHLNADVQP